MIPTGCNRLVANGAATAYISQHQSQTNGFVGEWARRTRSFFHPNRPSSRLSVAPFTDDRIIRETGLEARVAQIVGPVTEGLGYRLVRIRISGRDGLTLQIMAERADGTMAIEDCEKLSRDLSPVLDLKDPIDRTYRLEISSPGIDRPLVRRTDFQETVGQVAKIELARPIAGRKRFRGTIQAVDEQSLTLREDDAESDTDLPLGELAEARLVLTDAIIGEALRAERQRKKERAKAKKLARAADAPELIAKGD